MKRLVDFIKESMQINEALYLFKPSQKAAKVEDAIKNFITHAKKKYSFNNKQDLEKFFKDFVSYTHLERSLLKEFGLVDGMSIANLLISHKEELDKAGWNFSAISSFDETKMQKEYKAWKKSDDYIEGRKFDKNASKDSDEDELVRTLVIYDANNPLDDSTTIEYDFSGKRSKATDHQVNMLKMDWHYLTGLKYYDARPILLSNYLKKSDGELQTRGAIVDDIIGKMD